MNNADEMIMVSVEGEESTTLAEFIEINEDAIDDETIEEIRNLKVGNSTFAHICIVKRTA